MGSVIWFSSRRRCRRHRLLTRGLRLLLAGCCVLLCALRALHVSAVQGAFELEDPQLHLNHGFPLDLEFGLEIVDHFHECAVRLLELSLG